VRLADSFRGLREIPEKRSQIRLLRVDEIFQRAALDQLHGDEVHARGIDGCFADLMDGDDVGMAERGRGLRFLNESTHALVVLDELWRQNLQRDRPIERYIPREVDLPHTACAQERHDPETPDDGAWLEGGGHAYFFNPGVQCISTVTPAAGSASLDVVAVPPVRKYWKMRNRWPSGDTAYVW
jgi:hypothetical protein